MRSPGDTLPLYIPEGLPVLLRDLIHDHIGMYFDPSRLDVMLDKLTPLAVARHCASFMDYYYLLKYSQTREEWHHVMDALSVQETYFWREMDQIRALVDVIVPEWFAATQQPLRIWSAACASGEEPYTIAMALAESGRGHLPVQIIATDASCAALEKAQQGRFRERSFRAIPPEIRARYFTQQGDVAQLAPAIMRRVQFECRNLVEQPDVAAFATANIIFCRNVFIYFSPDAIRRTVEWMADYMPEGGKLFVGASESLLRLTKRFDLQQIAGAFVYVRKPQPSAGAPP